MDDAFWLRYLRAHANPRTRAVHAAGTVAASAVLAAALVRRKPRWVLAALAAGYAPAWTTHAFIERNRPETFSRPFASLAADYRMLFGLLTGTLASELERAGVSRAAV